MTGVVVGQWWSAEAYPWRDTDHPFPSSLGDYNTMDYLQHPCGWDLVNKNLSSILQEVASWSGTTHVNVKASNFGHEKNSLPPLTKTVCSLWIVSPFIAAVQCVNLWFTSLNFTNIQSFNDLAAGRLRSYNNYLLNSEIFPVATKSFACHPATVRREQWLRITYRSELDVYGVIERDLLLQILKLLHVLTAAGLHHILKVKHARLSAVQNNHGAEFRESGGRKANNQTVRLWSVGWQSCK